MEIFLKNVFFQRNSGLFAKSEKFQSSKNERSKFAEKQVFSKKRFLLKGIFNKVGGRKICRR